MVTFEYQITKHSAEEFSQLHFFCSDAGECELENVPDFQMRRLTEILDEQGADGWELSQISFGRDGLLIFWKREVSE